MGHRVLISTAKELGRPVVAYTFDNHPLVVVKGMNPPMLMTSEEKRDKLLELGVHTVAIETFDARLARMNEQVYIEMLCARFMPSAIVVGFNHTFGAGGRGGAETIQALSAAKDYSAIIVPPVTIDEMPVSSTRIRERIASGDIVSATELLGEPYAFEGIVIRNKGIGTRIGFPTANIPVPDKIMPPNGVYAVRARLDGIAFPGVMNIGVKPTVTETGVLTIETHLIGFDGDAYGKKLRLELLSYIRKEHRFQSEKALARQIQLDLDIAHRVYSS